MSASESQSTGHCASRTAGAVNVRAYSRSHFKASWLLIGGAWVAACSSPNPNVRARRLPSGGIAVKGPLAGPFETEQELAQNACSIMTRQPGASAGMYGTEYCALGYYSGEGKGYFLSYLSELRSRLDSGRKSCLIPSALDDEAHGDAVVFWAPHTHPHNREFSRVDLKTHLRWLPTRVAEKGTGRAFPKSILLLYREKTGECRVYRYELPSKGVFALRDGAWVPIGRVYDDEGNVEMLDGMGWLP